MHSRHRKRDVEDFMRSVGDGLQKMHDLVSEYLMSAMEDMATAFDLNLFQT